MEVSALKYSGSIGLHGRSPLLRLQSDERLIALVRRGSHAAFETLVSRYEGRLLPFCRHMLRSREDAEDVLQEVFAAAFNAILADDRPINVRPWLYRIARNRSLNHLRRTQAIAVDTMDAHFSDHGASTADKVHDREEFRLLVGDIQDLPETQRTALLLREMEALSYDQIAEAMETTVPSVKSLLVRARVSLAEAAEARLLSCEEVRLQLGEVAEGLQRRPSAAVRRHLRACDRCSAFQVQLKATSRALAALLPLSPLIVLKKLVLVHLGHSAGAGSGATASGATAGATAAGTSALAGSGAGGVVSTAIGAVATKAAAGFAAAALVTAGAVEVHHEISRPQPHHTAVAVAPHVYAPAVVHAATVTGAPIAVPHAPAAAKPARAKPSSAAAAAAAKHAAKPDRVKRPALPLLATAKPLTPAAPAAAPLPGRTQTQTDPTVLPPPQPTAPAATEPASTTPAEQPATATSPATSGSTESTSTTATTPSAATSTTPATTTPSPSPAPAGTGTTSTDPSSTPPPPQQGDGSTAPPPPPGP
jgi:RNA polymerase sigma factor (sigma-70 family)